MKNMNRNERHEPAAKGVGGPAGNRPAGADDIREATFNSGEQGPAYAIAKSVDQVTCINCFMIDLDCGILDPNVVGEAATQSADDLYEKCVCDWLGRDPVLAKAEVRNTGHGLHILLRLDDKYEPAKTVTQLRAGERVSREEILDLNRRVVTAPAHLWMQVLQGGERQSPCPLCGVEKNSLGVAGNWKVQCYGCGQVDAAALVYRHYSPEFLKKRKDCNNG